MMIFPFNPATVAINGMAIINHNKAEKENEMNSETKDIIEMITDKDRLISGLIKRQKEIYDEMEKLQERLRLAHEFIRKEQYSFINEGRPSCISCEAIEDTPCKPDCELQKILGKEKGSL